MIFFTPDDEICYFSVSNRQSCFFQCLIDTIFDFLVMIDKIPNIFVSDQRKSQFFEARSTKLAIFPYLIDEICNFSTTDRRNMHFSAPDRRKTLFLTESDEICNFFLRQINEIRYSLSQINWQKLFRSRSRKFKNFLRIVGKMCNFSLPFQRNLRILDA